MASGRWEFEVSRCLVSVAAIETDLVRLTAGLTENQFHAQPRMDCWSVAYCLEHLALAGQGFLEKWDAALASGMANLQDRPRLARYHWFHRAILKAAEPPCRIKTRAPTRFLPRARRPMADVLQRFLRMHADLRRRLERSRAVDPARTMVQSPFRAWISYPLGFSFDLALAHERRHLWQAWRAFRQIGGA
jgi:hypothetical protein